MGRKVFGCMSLRTCAILSAVCSLIFSVACLLLAFFKLRSVERDIALGHSVFVDRDVYNVYYNDLNFQATIMYSAYAVYSLWIIVTAPMSLGIFLEKQLLFIPWLIVTVIVILYSTAMDITILLSYLDNQKDSVLVFVALPVIVLLILAAIFGFVTVILYFKQLGQEERASESILEQDYMYKPDSKKYDAI